MELTTRPGGRGTRKNTLRRRRNETKRCGSLASPSGHGVGLVLRTPRWDEFADESFDTKDDQEMDEKKRRRMELDPLHNGLIKRRAALTHRDKDVVLDEHLGKAHVFSMAGPLSQQPGYYCSVCECVLKDSKSYLDHINGKKHLKLLGMSMRVERVGVERVKAKLSALKKAKTESEEEEDWKARAKRREEEQKNKRREQREKKRQKREEEEREGDGSDLDPEMMATMGFQGFSTSKK